MIEPNLGTDQKKVKFIQWTSKLTSELITLLNCHSFNPIFNPHYFTYKFNFWIGILNKYHAQFAKDIK